MAVTGSDTSSNALFGALQVQTAGKAGLDPLLLAGANSSGGVLGKMISPQNLAIAAAAVGMAGKEGDIFRRVIGWSLLLLLHVRDRVAAVDRRARLDGALTQSQSLSLSQTRARGRSACSGSMLPSSAMSRRNTVDSSPSARMRSRRERTGTALRW